MSKYFVAGAGTAAYNTTPTTPYVEAGISGGVPYFQLDATHFLHYAGGVWALAPSIGGTVAYYANGTTSAPPLTGWITQNGTAPAPTLTLAPYVTLDGNRIVGSSLHTKPTNVADGTTFLEEDTKDTYVMKGRAWVLQSRIFTDPGYISGLQLEYVSATQIKVKTGAAYVSSLAAIVTLSADSTLTPSRAASTWYYLYLKNDGTIESSTTAPAAAYFGTARAKTSDTTRRYLGAYKTDASSNIINFHTLGAHGLNIVTYRDLQYALPFRVLANGTATGVTTVDLSGIVPTTSRLAKIRVTNLSTTSGNGIGLRNSDASGDFQVVVGNTSAFSAIEHFDFPLNSSQALQYSNNTAGGAAYIDVQGYKEER